MGAYENRLNTILYNLKKPEIDIDLGDPLDSIPKKDLSVEELVVEMVKHGRRAYCAIPALLEREQIDLDRVLEIMPQRKLKQLYQIIEASTRLLEKDRAEELNKYLIRIKERVGRPFHSMPARFFEEEVKYVFDMYKLSAFGGLTRDGVPVV